MLGPWFLALAVFAGSVTCRSNRIVGGSPTTIDQYPSIVQVDSQNIWSGSWSQHCAGSILNTRYILSAAHCFDGSLYHPRYRRIRAGATYRNYGGVLAYVEIAYNHPTYGKHGYDGDISVIRLSDRLVYSPVIQPTTLPTSDSIIPDGQPVSQVGWGFTSQGGPPSEVLRYALVFTINNDLCRERYATIPDGLPVTENMICSGGLDVGGRGICQGDSGGPLYLRLYAGRFIEFTIGVASWTEGCAKYELPSVNIAVAPYVEWILNLKVVLYWCALWVFY